MANIEECKKARILPQDVDRIAKRLNKLMSDADKLGISLFCGSANTLRAYDGEHQKLIVSGDLTFNNADGGCGACREDEHGLLRGE